MSLRTERAAELIRRELAPILERDYVFKGMVLTIQAVDLDPDLKSGRVWVSILGGKDYDHQEVIEKLRANRAHIQKALYKRVVMKSSPQLFFKLDSSVARGVRILNAIDSLPPPAPDQTSESGDLER
ncbi:MAG: ribosome-binding factor A [Verrucomicrobiaceae bacterium]|nr:ribosome-binding factor A [Verrucomicrobiaceae bacterium]